MNLYYIKEFQTITAHRHTTCNTNSTNWTRSVYRGISRFSCLLFFLALCLIICIKRSILRDVWSSPPVTIPVGERKYCAVWRNTGRTSPERRNTGWWFPYIGNTLEPLKRQQRKQRYCCTRWFMGSRIMLMDKMNINFIQNGRIINAL